MITAFTIIGIMTGVIIGNVVWMEEAFVMNIQKGKIMTDYIKKEDALSTFPNNFYAGLTKKIVALPPADVAPVQHGHWMDEGAYADYTNVHAWRCSECEDHVLNYKCDLSRYCPNCGAKMDGEIK